jgi:hypothetical protein
MKSSRSLWVIAVIITIASAIYQRMTGPTYPLRIRDQVGAAEVSARLQRTEAGSGNHVVQVEVPAPVEGVVEWKRFKTADALTAVPMRREGALLLAELPHQPPAGKLEYRVILRSGETSKLLGPLVIRFRGEVPTAILIVHIMAMFGGMLLATRTGLAAWAREKNLKPLTLWTLAFLTIGGFVLGPIVQKYAFGALWTGWPFGGDLTDNKTAVAILIWVATWFALPRSRSARIWVIVATIATLTVFMIPHSVMGSELDYTKIETAPRP